MLQEHCQNIKLVKFENDFNDLVIFFPASGTSHRDFKNFIAYLSTKYNVFVINSGYFGLNDNDITSEEENTQAFFHNFYECFRFELETYRKIILIGQSIGGIEAIIFLKYFDKIIPGKVIKCLLASAPVTENHYKSPPYLIRLLSFIVSSRMTHPLLNMEDKGAFDSLLRRINKDILQPIHRAGAYSYLRGVLEITKFGIIDEKIIKDPRLVFLVGRNDVLLPYLNHTSLKTSPRYYLLDTGHSILQKRWEKVREMNIL